ncbi:MAG: RdgB/HAM1 family non-canonical purine NTP pyrophosphatase [Lachnospiraceae bacterium]|nr:RdgB/HAM1 family non-canonical purine NTP pyrophosphatase [Lachnospiraceae bacterium]
MDAEQRIVFATGNEGKMREVRAVLADLGLPVFSLKDLDIHAEIVEDGTTFEENARIKARAVHAVTGGLVLADDSGLEVDALDGAPGVYSARFMGEDTSYVIKNQAIMDQVAGCVGAERSARFRCVIAAVFPDGHEEVAEGTIEGQIAEKPSGSGGFGYDPIFWLPERGCTTADLPAGEKNAISHRGKALRIMAGSIAAWQEEQR